MRCEPVQFPIPVNSLGQLKGLLKGMANVFVRLALKRSEVLTIDRFKQLQIHSVQSNMFSFCK